MTSRLPVTQPEHSPSWHAELHLGFARNGEGTVLRENRHRGPLRVQKALYPEGDAVCQAILLHPPSGIAGGDQLAISVEVGAGARAQLTTPGAGKWYRSGGAEASQRIDFTVAAGATLEWLPQETIVFDGARARMETRVSLAADSRYIGWDILCLGRAGGWRAFRAMVVLTCFSASTAASMPIWLERGGFDGNDRDVEQPGRLGRRHGVRHAAVRFPGIAAAGGRPCSKPAAPSSRPMAPIMPSLPCPASSSPAISATAAKPPASGLPTCGPSCARPAAVDRPLPPESGIPEESSWN